MLGIAISQMLSLALVSVEHAHHVVGHSLYTTRPLRAWTARFMRWLATVDALDERAVGTRQTASFLGLRLVQICQIRTLRAELAYALRAILYLIQLLQIRRVKFHRWWQQVLLPRARIIPPE